MPHPSPMATTLFLRSRVFKNANILQHYKVPKEQDGKCILSCGYKFSILFSLAFSLPQVRFLSGGGGGGMGGVGSPLK